MRHPFTRRNGRRLLAVTALGAAVAGVPTAVASPWENGVRAGSLGHSLADAIGGVQRPLCEAGDVSGRWTCVVPVRGSRTLAEYRVRASGRCWSGRRDSGGPALPRSVRGCVGVWDQLRLNERL